MLDFTHLPTGITNDSTRFEFVDLLDFNNASNQENQPFEKLNSEQIKSELLNRIEDVLFYLFPEGYIKNNCFHIGSTKGNKGKSLIVQLAGERQGNWYDFAENTGGDILSLWSEARGYHKSDFSKLLTEISEWLGNSTSQKSHAPHLPQNFQQSGFYDHLGKPTAKWNYLDQDGNVIACISRYDTTNGKEFRVRDVKNNKAQAPCPRPLYNIPGIASAKKIILVEGEKSAEALIQKGFIATTAMFGANAPLDKTDWSPLSGKEVIIWPDNDAAGLEYSKKVAEQLSKIASFVSILTPPKDKPTKWDAADAVIEGFDIQSFLEAQRTATNSNQTISRINPASWIGNPPERQWLIDGWLPRGYVTALYGDGGVGKSLLAQQLMSCLATGMPWFDHEVIQSRVYGLMCEDDESELWRRQVGINQALGISMSDLSNICFTSRVGKNNFLMTFDGRDIGNPTPFFDELLQEIADFKADLVVLDTAADLFGGNEINRIHVRQFIQNACGTIARSINGAVLLCAHPSDSGMQRKTGTGGSTAWSNTVRSRWYLSYPDEAENVNPNQRILSRKKSNYASIGNKIDLIYQDGAFADNSIGILSERICGIKQGKKIDAERIRKRDVIIQILTEEALKGRLYTNNQFAEAFENKAGLGCKKTIKERVSILATKGHIKFNRNCKELAPGAIRSTNGVLCVKDMMFRKDEQSTVLIPPTHYKNKTDGVIFPVEDPSIWIVHDEEVIL